MAVLGSSECRILDPKHEQTVPAQVGFAEPAGATAVLSTAELADCTCPEFCERDHDND